MKYSILLYSFVVLFFFVEISLMIREKKHNKGTSDNDRGSRVIILLATGIGLTAAIVFSYTTSYNFGNFETRSLFWVGYAIMFMGLFLRVWGRLTLGKSFRSTVEAHTDQTIIKNGPYKIIRHPCYAGLILICLGFGIALQNWLSLAVVMLLTPITLIYRINVEEIFMEKTFGSQYEEYKLQTKRLIPWIW
jgi:protein-S-isoprenylcysteine O-methyltransferase Ste14